MLKNTGYGLLSNPLTAASLGLMAAGGPSPMPVSFGQALNEGLLAGREAHQENVKLGLLQDKRDMDAELNRWRIKEIQADIANPAKHGGDLGLIRMLADPNATEDQKKFAKQALAGNLPANVREYEYVQALSPEAQRRYLAIKRANQWFNRGDTYVSPDALDPAGPFVGEFSVGVPPEQQVGYRGQVVTREQQAKLRAQLDANRTRVTGSLRAMADKTDNMLTAVESARQLINASDTASGWGVLISDLPRTDARALKGYLKTINNNIAFTELRNMKQYSPTGSALGSVQVQELEMLKTVISSVDQGTSRDVLLKALDNVERQAKRSLRYALEIYKVDYPPSKFGNPFSNGNDGWSAERED